MDGVEIFSKTRLVRYWLIYVLVRIVICAIDLVPLAVLTVATRFVAFLFNDIFRVRRRVVNNNLHHAFPHWSAKKRRQVAREMWQHLFLIECEAIKARRILNEQNWRNYIDFSEKDKQRVDKYLHDDRGFIIVGCHFGNFEVGGMFTHFGYPSRYTVARPIRNPFLDRYITQLRETMGQKMLPKKGIIPDVIDLLKKGDTIGVLADQYGGDTGCWVNFFNRPTSYHKSIALFALIARVPIFVGSLYRSGKPMRFSMTVDGILDPDEPRWKNATVTEVTQWYSDLFEQIIRVAPEQYWWVHRRWKIPQKQSIRRRRLKQAA